MKENLVFLDELGSEEKLAVKTCPSFELAAKRAEEDRLNYVSCTECASLKVKKDSLAGGLLVKGKCPKI